MNIYTHTHTKCTYERTQSTFETTARQQLRGQPNLTPRSSALLPVRITTARRPDHIRLSALVWSRSTQFIVHASSQLCHGPPKQGHFSAILARMVCTLEGIVASYCPNVTFFFTPIGHAYEHRLHCTAPTSECVLSAQGWHSAGPTSFLKFHIAYRFLRLAR